MVARISRRKLAEHAARQLAHDSASARRVIDELAAYLVESGRTAELDLLVRDIESALAHRGIVVADVVSAHPLTDEARQRIERLVGATTLHLRETIDSNLIGGLKLRLPDQELDQTVARHLRELRAQKV